ncbi:MAG: hypothetical protein KF726_14815 [Anaerolineae bacterium]|nr:hypothetical protein [Anaerolineae bacterium]
MELQNFRDFTKHLQQNLETDPRVIGLVALGSMAEQGRTPDVWSDHDFFVITVEGVQESFRQDLSWLPDSDKIVLAIRETEHGLKVFYEEGHLLEFAVFSIADLTMARVNDFRVLLDRADIAAQMAAIQQPEAAATTFDPRRAVSMVLALSFVGTGRYRRGEQLSAHAFVKFYLLHHLLPLLAHVLKDQAKTSAKLDNLDPFRRFEAVFPDAGAQINRALLLPIPQAALALIDIAEQYARPAISDYPATAVQMVRSYIQRL